MTKRDETLKINLSTKREIDSKARMKQREEENVKTKKETERTKCEQTNYAVMMLKPMIAEITI